MRGSACCKLRLWIFARRRCCRYSLHQPAKARIIGLAGPQKRDFAHGQHLPGNVEFAQSFTVGRRDQCAAVGIPAGRQQYDGFALDRVRQVEGGVLILRPASGGEIRQVILRWRTVLRWVMAGGRWWKDVASICSIMAYSVIGMIDLFWPTGREMFANTRPERAPASMRKLASNWNSRQLE